MCREHPQYPEIHCDIYLSILPIAHDILQSAWSWKKKSNKIHWFRCRKYTHIIHIHIPIWYRIILFFMIFQSVSKSFIRLIQRLCGYFIPTQSKLTIQELSKPNESLGRYIPSKQWYQWKIRYLEYTSIHTPHILHKPLRFAVQTVYHIFE